MDSCDNTDGPSTHTSAGCQLSQCDKSIDLISGVQTLTCLLENGGTAGGKYWGVSDYPGSDNDFSFWGEMDDGTLFCCVADASTSPFIDTIDVQVVGSDGADHINWTYSAAGATSDLSYPASVTSQQVTGHVTAGSGGDFIYGPATSQLIVYPEFRGEDGDDYILVGGNKPLAYGGRGEDTIDARNCPTTTIMYGESPIIVDTNGHDVLIAGDNGNTMFGNFGDDVLCGGTHDDLFSGGGGDD